jgi:hypothetical protein
MAIEISTRLLFIQVQHSSRQERMAIALMEYSSPMQIINELDQNGNIEHTSS